MLPLQQAKRVVIKLGTGVLTSGIGDLDTARIEALCYQVKALRDRGIDVILVSSGAVGLGAHEVSILMLVSGRASSRVRHRHRYDALRNY